MMRHISFVRRGFLSWTVEKGEKPCYILEAATRGVLKKKVFLEI